MLLFGDRVAIARAGPRFPTTDLTWEAWLLSYDVSSSTDISSRALLNNTSDGSIHKEDFFRGR